MGIMTIGMFGYDITKGPNPDFLCLKECRETLVKELDMDSKQIELSMGMSNDYEHAVRSIEIIFIIFQMYQVYIYIKI